MSNILVRTIFSGALSATADKHKSSQDALKDPFIMETARHTAPAVDEYLASLESSLESGNLSRSRSQECAGLTDAGHWEETLRYVLDGPPDAPVDETILDLDLEVRYDYSILVSKA
jgi:hypothetical protein